MLTTQSLINTQLATLGDSYYVRQLRRAKSYYENDVDNIDIYSSYWSKINPTDYPRVKLPLARDIVDQSADMLFGNAPTVQADNRALAVWLSRLIYTDNDGQNLLLQVARAGGVYGKVALRWRLAGADEGDGKDTSNDNPLRLEYYTPLEFEAVYDPLDRRRVVKIYLQIVRQDPMVPGQVIYYRESWDDELRTVYSSPTASTIVNYAINPTGWIKAADYSNPYGVIPFAVLINRPVIDDPAEGVEDCYGMYELFDRLNITYSDWDAYNQVKGRPVYFGKYLLNQNETLTVAPGSVILGHHESSDLKPVDGSTGMYESFRVFVERVESNIYKAVQASQVDPAQVTGLGNLSGRALQMLYAPLVRLTERKRLSYGRGIEMLLEQVARQAKLLGIRDTVTLPEYEEITDPLTGAVQQEKRDVEVDPLAEVNPNEPETYDVSLHYPPLFPENALDRQQDLDALTKAQGLGAPSEWILEQIARLYGEDDIDGFLAKAGFDQTLRDAGPLLERLRADEEEARVRDMAEVRARELTAGGGNI